MLRKTGTRKDVSFEVIFRACLNNLIAHYILEEESLSHSLSTRLIASYKKSTPKAGAQGISIALVIHSFDRTLHIAIAVIIHSFDRSLQEINPKGWCAVRTLHIAIAVIIHSFDRSLISRLIAPYKCTTNAQSRAK